MCVDPVTIGAGAAVIGTGLSIVDRISSAGAAGSNRDAALRTVMTETVPEINKSLANVYNSNQARAIQESDAAATQSFDILRGMAEAKSTAKAAAGDIGVGGVSFANILSDFEMREGMTRANIDQNYRMTANQINEDNLAAQQKAKAQINTSINAAVQGNPVPSGAGLWAGIGADAVGGAIKIADRFELFKKPTVDAKTGRTIDNSYDR